MVLNDTLKQINNYIEGCISQPSMQMQHLSGAGHTCLLEQKLCNHYSKKYAIAYCNATTALMALCSALQLKRDEIITTPFNWGGSISPFLFCNNKVIFSSVDDITLNIAANNLSGGLSSKTKAILSTDFNGTPADSKAVKAFCKQHGLFYISDSAQSLGAYRDNKPGGFYADAIVLSFSPGKSFFCRRRWGHIN
ncbi:MAG: DegT/DnrJ/EryC1/StrS aminotransferase family protein [Chitinophagaceae bacterium]|nr:DegT/DnrJ/EryC1/StrS aminotransferase family protein [Chitinophagaceae bacterium]